MSFDYDKITAKDQDHSWWTSYADLWSMLSMVFLLLFVTASLRSGSQGIQQQIEHEALRQKNSDLQEQLRVYSNLRDETLSANGEKEQEVYQKLISKLSLLQEDAKNEKEGLRRKAKENEEKEFALNQYQQIVRNIIDSNILSKSQIKRRDLLIVEKKQTIQELNKEVARQEDSIAQNEKEIQSINSQLEQQINKLKSTQKRAKLSKQQMARAVEKLRSESANRVASLRAENIQAQGKLEQELQKTKVGYANQLANLRAENESKLAGERAAFEKNLASERLSAEGRAAKLAAFKQAAERKAGELEGQLAGLAGKIRDTEGQLAAAERARGSAEAGRAAAESDRNTLAAQTRSLAQEKEALGGELAKAQALLATKKNLIAQLQSNFAKRGIKAKVDGKSGDVTIDFGEEYFDTGSFNLKPKMVQALNNLIPTYSQSLFQDPKTAAKISNIEIIGFASSTYKGKYVNPRSLKPENQQAIDYNLKLSFSRANSIFKHIFNPRELAYDHQKRLLPLVKVVGRGFLPEGVNPANIPEDMPESEFCAQYNCKKAQRVIVKFNLKD